MGSKAGSASKVKLNSFDDLFGGAENATGEQIVTRQFNVDEKSILISLFSLC